MKKVWRAAVALSLVGALSGCLGTIYQTPTIEGPANGYTTVRLLASPALVEAHECKQGLANAQNFVPLWGLVVGILTFGIVVPVTVNYSCVVTR